MFKLTNLKDAPNVPHDSKSVSPYVRLSFSNWDVPSILPPNSLQKSNPWSFNNHPFDFDNMNKSSKFEEDSFMFEVNRQESLTPSNKFPPEQLPHNLESPQVILSITKNQIKKPIQIENKSNSNPCQNNPGPQISKLAAIKSVKIKRKRFTKPKLASRPLQIFPTKMTHPVLPIIKCLCKRSNCLKLYCECFSVQGFCGDSCGCQGCLNRESTIDVRSLAVTEILQRNPMGFVQKFKLVEEQKNQEAIHCRGCKCAKSRCVKNYCECFSAAVGCSDLCKCQNCKNNKKTLGTNMAEKYKVKIVRKKVKLSFLRSKLDPS